MVWEVLLSALCTKVYSRLRAFLKTRDLLTSGVYGEERFLLLLLMFGLAARLAVVVLRPGIEFAPQHWKRGVLTIGLPGSSLGRNVFDSLCVFNQKALNVVYNVLFPRYTVGH